MNMDHHEPPTPLERALLVAATIAVTTLVCVIAFAGEAKAASRPPCQTAIDAITCYWPAHSRQYAIRVAECESTASAPEYVARKHGLGRWARNGQYIGIFQMGTKERKRYGWYRIGAPARIQVRSAMRLYWHRGWQPWACA